MLKKSDVVYKVDEPNRVVIASVKDTEYDFMDYADNFFADRKVNVGPYHTDETDECDQYLMPHSFWGKARCSVDDEWNPEVGKLIAYDRLKNKYWRSFFKVANKYFDDMQNGLEDMYQDINGLGDRLTQSAKQRYDKIQEYIGTPVEN